MILLTDEEINYAVKVGWLPLDKEELTQAELSFVRDRSIAKAQLKKVVGWMCESCYEHSVNPIELGAKKRMECSTCMQALLDEVEE